MSNFTQAPIVTAKQVFSSSAVQEHQLGSFARTRDGRGFRYARAGAVNLVVGHVLQAAAQVANHQALTPTADVAVGATTISVTLGATAAAENLYGEGFATVGGPGIGYQYAISGHAAVLSAGVLTANLFPDDPVQVALTAASSLVTLIANPYKNVISSPATTLTSGPVGVATFIILATEYGWVQTHGPAVVIMPAATPPAVGAAIAVPSATAGTPTTSAAGLATIGWMLEAGDVNAARSAFLTID